MVNQEIKQLLDACPSTSQARLASAAEVNRGQFNAWLKSGNNLADDKVVALIDALLEWMEGDGAECKTRHADLLKKIVAFPAYQATQANAFPDQPVPAGHPTYIERNTEGQLARMFELPPVDIAVVGGPKTGKTSILNWLQQHLRHRHTVVRCDFRAARLEPLRAIEQATKGFAPKNAPRLRDWSAFPEWARRYLLGGKPCTLMLDHIQELPAEQLRSLQDGLHHAVNARREEPLLDKLNLVAAFDEGAPSLRQTRDHASGMTRDFRSLVLPRFTESQVAALLKAITQISDEDELDALAQRAWEAFQGHPFLTHCWAETLAGQTKSAPDAALVTIEKTTHHDLFRPYFTSMDEAIQKVVKEAVYGAGPFPSQLISPPVRLWLQDSGLFTLSGLGGQATIAFASNWIRDQFAAAIKD